MSKQISRDGATVERPLMAGQLFCRSPNVWQLRCPMVETDFSGRDQP